MLFSHINFFDEIDGGGLEKRSKNICFAESYSGKLLRYNRKAEYMCRLVKFLTLLLMAILFTM